MDKKTDEYKQIKQELTRYKNKYLNASKQSTKNQQAIIRYKRHLTENITFKKLVKEKHPDVYSEILDYMDEKELHKSNEGGKR